MAKKKKRKKCVACSGTGKNSKGGRCMACQQRKSRNSFKRPVDRS